METDTVVPDVPAVPVVPAVLVGTSAVDDIPLHSYCYQLWYLIIPDFDLY